MRFNGYPFETHQVVCVFVYGYFASGAHLEVILSGSVPGRQSLYRCNILPYYYQPLTINPAFMRWTAKYWLLTAKRLSPKSLVKLVWPVYVLPLHLYKNPVYINTNFVMRYLDANLHGQSVSIWYAQLQHKLVQRFLFYLLNQFLCILCIWMNCLYLWRTVITEKCTSPSR